MTTLIDPRVAQEIISTVDTRFDQLRRMQPYTAYGTVATVDAANRRCSVYVSGDTVPSVGFAYGSPLAPAVGERVRVVIDPRGDRYVDSVVDSAAYARVRRIYVDDGTGYGAVVFENGGTRQALLDVGNGGSGDVRVLIGSGNTERMRVYGATAKATFAADVGVGAGASPGVQGGGSGVYVRQSGSVELRTVGSTPYIDFTNDDTNDFDARLILTGDDELQLQSAVFNGLSGLQINGNRVARFVPITPIAVYSGATTTTTTETTLTPEVTGLPATGVVAAQCMVIVKDSAPVSSSYAFLSHYTAGGDVAVAYATSATLAEAIAATVQTGGTNSRQVKMIVRAGGTLTYWLYVTAYWTTE